MNGDWGAEGKQDWDASGAHLAMACRVIRALHNGTGCHLTPEMVRALDFAEGDGDWWNRLKVEMYPDDYT